jgi:hypothetical protein
MHNRPAVAHRHSGNLQDTAMSHDLYQQRIREFCACVGMESDSQSLLENGLLNFDGRDLCIRYSASGGGAYRLHIDLGMLADDCAAKVHEIMLEQNFQNEEDAGFKFARHPDSRRATVTVCTPFDSIADGTQLAAWIDAQISRSDAWSENVSSAVSKDHGAERMPPPSQGFA